MGNRKKRKVVPILKKREPLDFAKALSDYSVRVEPWNFPDKYLVEPTTKEH